MSPGKMVAIDFNSDDTLQIACAYREREVYPAMAGSINGKAILTDNQTTQALVNQSLEAPGVVYITGVAHGASDSFPGNSDDPPIFATGTGGYDPQTIRGRIVHLLSCNTGDFLGRALADPNGGGAAAFFGYRGNFTWPTGQAEQYAAIFFKCDAQIDLALANGKSAGEAYAAAIAMFESEHQALIAEGSDMSLQVASMLETNKELLCAPSVDRAYGNSQATL